MRLDLTSFAFGFSIKTSAGNPNWATSLGQGSQYKINPSDSVNNLLKGMVHLSVPLRFINARIGKGGKTYSGEDPAAGVLLGSVFEKVYVNGNLVNDCRFVLLITRDMSKSHFGRLRLKYSPHNLFEDNNGKIVSNASEIEKIRNALGLSADACWFVYELRVIDQDQLHLFVAIPNGVSSENYNTNDELHEEWRRLIPVEECVKSDDTKQLSENSRLQEMLCSPADLSKEFSAWLTDVYKTKDGSVLGDSANKSYVNSLFYLTDTTKEPGKYDEHSTSYWYNMYHFLYGKDGPSVFFFFIS